MANPEFKGTVVPKTEPIVDPIPKLYEQFEKPWGQAWARPPLRNDGTEITTAEELKEAEESKDLQDKKYHVWQGACCHATCVSMVVNWLVNQYSSTAGKVGVPRRTDEKAPVDPLHVAYWLWQLGKNPKQTEFVSDSDHPPYVPYRKAGKSWKMDHSTISRSMGAITLIQEGKAPEKLVCKSIGLTPTTLSKAKVRFQTMAKLSQDRKKAQADLDDIDKNIETADKKEKAKLKKDRVKLKAKLDSLDKQIAKNDVEEGAALDADWIESQRQKNKNRLKEALIRGPVLLNMTLPGGHYILLFGYRDRMMYIIDPGASIPRFWFGRQTGFTDVPGGRMRESRDVLAIDAEAEFENIPLSHAKKAKTTKTNFLDNLLGAEHYYFDSLGKPDAFNKTKSPEILPFDKKDVAQRGGG
jgi:hypothetical protein